MPESHRNRWWIKGPAIGLAVLFLGAFLVSRYVGEAYRAHLAAAVRDQLGAELLTGSVFYRPPYGFMARDVRIIRREPNGTPVELMHADALSLDLAGMPRQGQPIHVTQLSLDHPLLRVERWKRPMPARQKSAQSPPPPTRGSAAARPVHSVANSQKPSAPAKPAVVPTLRLDRLVINDGSIEYERPDDARSARIEHLQARLVESSSGTYQCTAAFNDPSAVNGNLSGTLDVGTLQLSVSRIALMVQAKPVIQQLPLADEIVRKLVGLGIDGKLSVEGTGTIPLSNVRHAQYQLSLGASGAVLQVPRWNASFDHGAGRLLLRSLDAPAEARSARPAELTFDRLQLVSGRASLRIDGGTLTLFPDQKSWKLSQLVGRLEMGKHLPFSPPNSGWFFDRGEFSGPVKFTMAASGPLHVDKNQSPFEAIRHEVLVYPEGVTIRPQRFPLPIERITGGPVAFRSGVIRFQNLTGTYGGDAILLHSARLTLEDPVRKVRVEDLRSQVRFEEIAGTIIFRQPNAAYPGTIGKTVAQLRPTGPFVIGGGSWYALNRPPRDRPEEKLKPDFFIRLLADGSSFAVSTYRIPLTDVHGESTIAPLAVNVSQFQAKSTGGTVWARGLITPGKPWLFEGHAQVRDVDLRQLAGELPLGQRVRQRVSGQGYADLKLSGGSSDSRQRAADRFTADGEFEILHGDFWSVPTVGEVARHVHQTDELGTGDAAGVVHVARRIVTLDNAAINSPLLGLQGSGTIGFDRSLNLTVVAAPLGDWRDRMKEAGIPIVGDVLGAVQKLLNAAQGAVLYQFKIEGSVSKPAVTLIPAPAITEPLALLFGQMLGHPAPGQLLDEVKQKPATAPAAGGARPAAGQLHPR